MELESLLPRYAAEATGLIHGDLRVDNVLIGADGRAWFCDWTWVCSGPAWFDLAGLLLTAYASGLDADRLFAAHPATTGAPPDALDATLAALAGYYLTGAAAAPPTASPHQPAHQRWSGEQSLDWLARPSGLAVAAPPAVTPARASVQAEPFWLVPGDLVTWLFARR